jgi:hypothetical protein
VELTSGVRRLRAIVLAAAFACFLAVALMPVVASATDPAVNFPDHALDTAVRTAIGKPTGQIYASNLSTLTVLSAESKGIVHLDGLQYATNGSGS